MLITLAVYNSTFTELTSISYSALVLILMLNIYSALNRVNWVTVGAIVFTLGIYVFAMWYARDYLACV